MNRALFLRPKYSFARMVQKYFTFLPDKIYLKLLYWGYMGKCLNLDSPKTFSEKLQWLKLYNRNPEYTKMVDKVEVKDYVASIIGEDYIIPTYGVYENFDDINFDELPDKFVLKTSNGGGSGGVIICRDKSKLNKQDCRFKLERSMKSNIYKSYKEWPYKNVKPRILAEQLLDEGIERDLPDYKFFCFNGEPRYCQVIRDRHCKETIDFYDMQWQHQEFVGLNPVADNGLNPVAKPLELTTMQQICRSLSKGHPFLRVDLYVVNNKEYFGELTFYPFSGFGEFNPDYWNKRLGRLLILPEPINRGGKN